MRSTAWILLATLCCQAVTGKVITLSDSNFDQVLQGAAAGEIWAVEFFAPWCGHCKQLAPEWDKFSEAASPFIKARDQHSRKASEYGVKGFPTIKFFVGTGPPLEYQGARNADGLASFGLDLITKTVNKKLGKGSSGSSSGSKSSGGSGGGGGGGATTLTEVLKSDELWLVEFMAPWCGHCQKLKPEWEQAARELDGEARLGVVDATQEQALAQTYGVEGFPTIFWFKNGQSEAYNGPREASGIVAAVQDELGRFGGGAAVPQLLDNDTFLKKCNKVGLCVLVFLPHILDDTAAGRETNLAIVNDVATQVKGRPFRFFWSEGGAQSRLEEALNLGFGYPAVVALSLSKKRYATMTGTFEASKVVKFLQDVLSGKARLGEVHTVPKISKTDEWDGKDGELPVEEDIDLD